MTANRIWELDFVRGTAIIGVIAYHIIFDLQNIFGFNFGYSWQWTYNFAAVFVLISGICAQFSRNNLSRGFRLGAVALGVTLVTYLYSPYSFVQFGILHMLALCMILHRLLFFRLSDRILAALGCATIIIGIYLNSLTVSVPHLYVFGLMDTNFFSMDYFPMFPWAGYFMIGIFISRRVYKDKQSLFHFVPKWTRIIEFLGRHSLAIYIVHQPIIMLILSLALSKPL